MYKSASASLVLLLAAFVSTAPAQKQLVPLTSFGPRGDGTLLPGDVPFLTSDGARYQRGMAFNPVTGHLIIVNRFPINSETINVIDALTGSSVTTLDQSSRATGGAANFTYDLVGVAADGAVYVGNLSTSGTLVQFNLYRWADENSPQALVYFGNPGNTTDGGSRWGDTMAVRGSGMNTEVLLSTQNGTLAAVLKPSVADLSVFTNAPLNVALPSGSLGYGLAFSSGNTFYGKAASVAGSPLYLMTYNVNAGTATGLYTNGLAVFPGTAGPLGVSTSSNWLACLASLNNTNPHPIRLYDISTPASPPALLDRVSVPVWTNANGVYAGAVVFGFGTNLYALDSDNGVAAFTIADGAHQLEPSIYGQPQSQVVQLTSNAVFSVGVDGSPTLTYQWRLDGTNIANATASSLTLTNVAQTNQGSYSVVVTNSYGSNNSAVAVLTVLASFGNNLVYEPFNYVVGSFLDGQGGWVLNTGARMAIQAGNLDVPYLAHSAGNHVVVSANGTTRFPIGTYSQGSLYFSFAMKLDDATATTSETTAGFAVGTAASYTPKVNIAGDGTGKYTIGVYKNTGTTTGGVATNLDGSTNLFLTGTTVFVVARSVYNSGSSTDDTCDLWVNPDPSTFGALNPPTPSVGPIGAGRADLTGVDRFALRDSSGYPGRHFDDVRVGFDWASVTPPANPSLDISLSGSTAKLRWPTNISTGYILQSIRSFDDVDGWQAVGTPVIVEGVSNTVSVTTSGMKFYRLKK